MPIGLGQSQHPRIKKFKLNPTTVAMALAKSATGYLQQLVFVNITGR
jgi:hypothetical protein